MQLYHYKFGRIDFGPDKGAYSHPEFQRNDKLLSVSIQRSLTTAELKEQQSSSRRPPAIVTSNYDCYGTILPTSNGKDQKIKIEVDKFLLLDATICPNEQPIACNMNEEVTESNDVATKYHNLKKVAPSKSSVAHDWLGDWLDREVSSLKTNNSLDDLEPRPFPDENRLENLLFML